MTYCTPSSRLTIGVLACALGFGGPATAAQPLPFGPTWAPSTGEEQLPLWPNGATDMPPGPRPPEGLRAVRTGHGPGYLAITEVSTPTVTVFQPKLPAVSGAVLVFPGGGFRALAIDIEGEEACAWLTARGLRCALVKYRVPRSNHHWDVGSQRHVTPPVAWAVQDAQRAVRLVRAQAQALGIDPQKIGVMGFSAGGYLVAQLSATPGDSYRPVDAIDAQSSRPDFAVALYPGHICRQGSLDPGLRFTKTTPPTFLLHAWDDPVDPVCNSTLYAQALAAAGAKAEVHLFAQGGHAFGLRSSGLPVSSWPRLVEDWLRTIGVLPR
ncbi:MAG: alpha/beta hydrolase [Deltaproteobacteria bacterium]|nr:alpha/beta hydrolase [Deltaproteobacteria bacterium]